MPTRDQVGCHDEDVRRGVERRAGAGDGRATGGGYAFVGLKQLAQRLTGAFRLPHAHGVQRNVDLALEPVLCVVRGPPVPHEDYLADHGGLPSWRLPNAFCVIPSASFPTAM